MRKVTQKSRKEFAEKLKAWRERKGFTQAEAAQHLGIPIGTLQNWEHARARPLGLGYAAILQMFEAP